jgi:hypothetical protein
MEHSLGTDCLLFELESLNGSPMKVLNYSEALPPPIWSGLGSCGQGGLEGGKPDVDFGLLETLANRRRRKENPQQKQPLWQRPGSSQGGGGAGG